MLRKKEKKNRDKKQHKGGTKTLSGPLCGEESGRKNSNCGESCDVLSLQHSHGRRVVAGPSVWQTSRFVHAPMEKVSTPINHRLADDLLGVSRQFRRYVSSVDEKNISMCLLHGLNRVVVGSGTVQVGERNTKCGCTNYFSWTAVGLTCCVRTPFVSLARSPFASSLSCVSVILARAHCSDGVCVSSFFVSFPLVVEMSLREAILQIIRFSMSSYIGLWELWTLLIMDPSTTSEM